MQPETEGGREGGREGGGEGGRGGGREGGQQCECGTVELSILPFKQVVMHHSLFNTQ